MPPWSVLAWWVSIIVCTDLLRSLRRWYFRPHQGEGSYRSPRQLLLFETPEHQVYLRGRSKQHPSLLRCQRVSRNWQILVYSPQKRHFLWSVYELSIVHAWYIQKRLDCNASVSGIHDKLVISIPPRWDWELKTNFCQKRLSLQTHRQMHLPFFRKKVWKEDSCSYCSEEGTVDRSSISGYHVVECEEQSDT